MAHRITVLCERCGIRPLSCKGLCARCYQASKARYGRWETRDEAIARRNFQRMAGGVLTGPNGEEWLIDLADFSLVCDRLWYDNGNGYARDGRNRYLHSVLLDCSFVDHRDGDRRNNHRSNLRPANRALNGVNKLCPKRDLPRGIYRTPAHRFQVRIQISRIRHYAGTFDSVEQAINALNELVASLGLKEYFTWRTLVA